jgi:hypothetical protein
MVSVWLGDGVTAEVSHMDSRTWLRDWLGIPWLRFSMQGFPTQSLRFQKCTQVFM